MRLIYLFILSSLTVGCGEEPESTVSDNNSEVSVAKDASSEAVRESDSGEMAKELRVEEIIGFQPGDRYGAVRERVIGYGYQLDGDLSEEMGYGQAFQLRDINGWSEVTHCWPTGASQCEYRFRWNDRFYLFLYTEGECYDEQSFCDLPYSGKWRIEDIR